MLKVRFVAVVEKKRLQDLDNIAKDLGRVGMEVDQVLTKVGLISGVGEAGIAGKLKMIDGVEHVREEKSFSLPPMDDNTPQ